MYSGHQTKYIDSVHKTSYYKCTENYYIFYVLCTLDYICTVCTIQYMYSVH